MAEIDVDHLLFVNAHADRAHRFAPSGGRIGRLHQAVENQRFQLGGMGSHHQLLQGAQNQRLDDRLVEGVLVAHLHGLGLDGIFGFDVFVFGHVRHGGGRRQLVIDDQLPVLRAVAGLALAGEVLGIVTPGQQRLVEGEDGIRLAAQIGFLQLVHLSVVLLDVLEQLLAVAFIVRVVGGQANLAVCFPAFPGLDVPGQHALDPLDLGRQVGLDALVLAQATVEDQLEEAHSFGLDDLLLPLLPGGLDPGFGQLF